MQQTDASPTPTPTPTTTSDGPMAADRLLAALGSIRRNARRRAQRPSVLSTLTDAQVELVRLVRRRPGITVNEAADSLNLASNTVSTLVGQLTTMDILSRDLDPHDRRVARLALRPGLRSKVDAWRDRRHSVLAAAIDGLPDHERSSLVAALPALEHVGEWLGTER